jgi:hypothetical protein
LGVFFFLVSFIPHNVIALLSEDASHTLTG